MYDDYGTIITSPEVKRRRINQQIRELKAQLEQLDRAHVQISLGGRRYCYALNTESPSVQIGDWVRVELPGGKPHYAQILAFGKGSYTGTAYKVARLVEHVV